MTEDTEASIAHEELAYDYREALRLIEQQKAEIDVLTKANVWYAEMYTLIRLKLSMIQSTSAAVHTDIANLRWKVGDKVGER